MKFKGILLITTLFILLLGTNVYAQETISLGDSIEGALDNSTALYNYTANAGETVTISLNSEDFNPFLRIRDANDVELGQDDDSGGRPNARLFFTAPEDGTYTITVGSFYGADLGSYTLTVEPLSAAAITYDTPVTLEMAENPTQLVSFDGTEGDVLNVRVISDADEDSKLILYAPDSSQLAADESSGVGSNPYLSRIVLPSTGVYVLQLSPATGAQLTANLTVTLEQTEALMLDTNPQTVQVDGEFPELETYRLDGVLDTPYRIVIEAPQSPAMTIEVKEAATLSFTSITTRGTNRIVLDYIALATEPITVTILTSTFPSATVDLTVSLEPVE